MKQCSYCGKNIEGEGISIYGRGELLIFWCSSNCMNKTTKKISQLKKKIGQENFNKLLNDIQEGVLK
jgi:ribosomal protein L24E